MVQQGLWSVAKKRLLEDGGVLPNEDGSQLRENIEVNMKRTFSAVGCVRLRKEKKRKWQKLKEEAENWKEVREEKESWREKGEELRSKKGVWIGCLAKFSRT